MCYISENLSDVTFVTLRGRTGLTKEAFEEEMITRAHQSPRLEA